MNKEGLMAERARYALMLCDCVGFGSALNPYDIRVFQVPSEPAIARNPILPIRPFGEFTLPTTQDVLIQFVNHPISIHFKKGLSHYLWSFLTHTRL